ncbi:MAG: DoxX family protein [Sphingobacteriales bacterium]|nr:DoxX family protein [Sphingobacteriales bacterium]
MNTALWIIQGLLAALFLVPGLLKLTTSKEKLVEKQQLSPGAPPLPVRIIGLFELLGSAGIIFPLATGILPVLTPLSALGFCIVMAGAFVVHYKKKEFKILPLLVLIFILSGIVAWFRIP